MASARIRETSASVAAYLACVERIPLLSREQEQEAACRLRVTGDARAAHRLVTANLRFVVKVAREFLGQGLLLPDLIQEGNLGLMRAVQRFDPARNVRLITYAAPWIRSSIRHSIIGSRSLVKLGTTQAQLKVIYALARARGTMEQAEAAGEGAPGEDERLAARLAVRPSLVREVRARLDGHDVSIDAVESTRQASGLLRERLSASPAQDGLADAEEQRQLAHRVAQALDGLDRRERLVVTARLLTEPPMPIREVAARLGVCRQRARQLELRALAKLRGLLRAGGDPPAHRHSGALPG